jgi:hypothetical protein
MDKRAWLKAAKAALLAAGFRRDPRQVHKAGQTWGLIRQEPEDMQFHVRAYKDGRLEAEMELSNKYVQHLWSRRSNAALALMDELERAGLPSDRVVRDFAPNTGSHHKKTIPHGRTPAAVIVGSVFTLGALALAWRLRHK